MTPAINVLRQRNVEFQIVEYDHDPTTDSYGREAVEATGANPDHVFKTLVVMVDGHRAVVAVIPVNTQLSLKAVAAAAKAKKAKMADHTDAERLTGYVVGGISPIGQKKLLPTFIHQSAQPLPQVCVSGGRRGLEVCLRPLDLAAITTAQFVAIAASE